MTKKEAIELLEDLYGAIEDNHGRDYDEAFRMAIEALQTDRPHGEWIHREHCQVDEDAYEIATCSHCKAEITLEYPNDNYCPSCGARMKGGAE